MLSDINQTKKNKNHVISLRVAWKASKQKGNKTKTLSDTDKRSGVTKGGQVEQHE